MSEITVETLTKRLVIRGKGAIISCNTPKMAGRGLCPAAECRRLLFGKRAAAILPPFVFARAPPLRSRWDFDEFGAPVKRRGRTTILGMRWRETDSHLTIQEYLAAKTLSSTLSIFDF